MDVCYDDEEGGVLPLSIVEEEGIDDDHKSERSMNALEISQQDGENNDQVLVDGRPETTVVTNDIEGEEKNMGHGMRHKFPSTRLRDFVTHTIQKVKPSDSSSATHCSSGTPFPITHFVNCERFYVKQRKFLTAVNAGKEPKIFKEAMKEAGWRKAMKKEIRALEDQGTWVMDTLPPGKKALGSKWLYKIKYNSDGSIERLKARLVIVGNHQVEGINYNETFTPVTKMVTVRTFLAVAAIKGWEVHQMDVHNVFLHGDLSEEVYIKVPSGFQ